MYIFFKYIFLARMRILNKYLWTYMNKINSSRRKYNDFVANETIEDYSLRYAPKSFRSFSELTIANTALGSISFLAIEAIGASIAISYGSYTAIWAIIISAIIIFLTAIPISYHAARYNIDIDLITRSAGFGYIGSTITSLIYASFSFIFFALEAAIMAQALELYFGLPLSLGYLLSSIIIIPLVFYGITFINKLQLWTQPIWIIMMIAPFIAIYLKEPNAIHSFLSFKGNISNTTDFDMYYFGFALGISLALIGQIGEQVDYLRFMPTLHKGNKRKWWTAVLMAGPGWIVIGAAKQLGGIFLGGVVLLSGLSISEAKIPIEMYNVGYQYIFDNPSTSLLLATFFVIVSQIKINVTNAYAGSLAWSNFFSRVTHSHPGRVVWMVFNIGIALLLMELGLFDALDKVLGLYSNIAIAWISAVTADLLINKPLGLSPKIIEFKRAHLYNINPVGIGSMGFASVVSILSFMGYFGAYAQSYSSIIAMCLAFVLSPFIAWVTKGKYYIARENDLHLDNVSQEIFLCEICMHKYEKPDMTFCPLHSTNICSLCCSLDSLCHDSCKADTKGELSKIIGEALSRLTYRCISQMAAIRLFKFFIISSIMLFIIFIAAWMVQSSYIAGLDTHTQNTIEDAFTTFYFVISILICILVWWILLSHENRELAEKELEERNVELSSQKELYDLVFENSTYAIYILDLEKMSIDTCNGKAVEMMEYKSKSEILGINPTVLSPEFQHNGRRSEELVKEHIALAVKNTSFSFEWIHTTKTNRDFWVYITLTHILIKGKSYIHASLRNIDAKKEIELNLENQNLILEESQRLAHIGSWKFNLQSEKLSWSDEVYRIFEIDKDTIPSYELFLDSIHPEDRDLVNKAYEKSLSTQKRYEITHRLVMKDGRIKYVSEQCETTFDYNNEPLISIGTIQDITAQKEIEIQLLQNQAILLQQARLASAGEMIGNISHQWRQPLNTLGLLIQKLNMYYERDILDADKMKTTMQKSMALIEGMSTTIDDFRDFFTPEKGKEIFSIEEGIQKAYSIIEASLQNNSLKYTLDMKDTSIKIEGYINEFSQVIVNILNNAQDALIENKISNAYINVRVYQNKKNIIIEISDNAGGIDEAIIAKIFEPYFTTKKEGKGTGIGLYMSKIIIEEHHKGELSVKNREGCACFKIQLPIFL